MTGDARVGRSGSPESAWLEAQRYPGMHPRGCHQLGRQVNVLTLEGRAQENSSVKNVRNSVEARGAACCTLLQLWWATPHEADERSSVGNKSKTKAPTVPADVTYHIEATNTRDDGNDDRQLEATPNPEAIRPFAIRTRRRSRSK